MDENTGEKDQQRNVGDGPVARAKARMYEDWIRENHPDCPLLSENIVTAGGAGQREALLLAAVGTREGHLRWPHDEMCLARWDGFRDAASLALGMDPSDFDALVDSQ